MKHDSPLLPGFRWVPNSNHQGMERWHLQNGTSESAIITLSGKKVKSKQEKKRHHLISTLYRLSHPSRDRNNQTGATGSFWEDPLGLGQVSLLMFLLQMPLRMRKASVEKTREKWTRMETMFLRLSSVP